MSNKCFQRKSKREVGINIKQNVWQVNHHFNLVDFKGGGVILVILTIARSLLPHELRVFTEWHENLTNRKTPSE